MSGVLDALKREAAKLNDAERAQLAAWIIESLEPFDEGFDLHEEWAAEIERRLVQVDRGEVEPLPGDEVLARLRRRLG